MHKGPPGTLRQLPKTPAGTSKDPQGLRQTPPHETVAKLPTKIGQTGLEGAEERTVAEMAQNCRKAAH